MKVKYYVVDAFTNHIFCGNPAGVCILEKPLDSRVMQSIAFENNLSETAFVYKENGTYILRWFTPTFEIDLCGHATLATAYVIFRFVEPQADQIMFDTMSVLLTVEKKGDLLEMSFPQRMPKKIKPTDEIKEALGIEPKELYSERDLYVVLDSEEAVMQYTPDYEKLGQLHQWMGIVITAEGKDADFVSRFFCPELKLEDPVTGSSHSSLVPLWNHKKHLTKFHAKQLSKRGGDLYCKLGDNDVKIQGEAVLYLEGYIEV